jgi:aminoglycoside phosphotransferase (APT) family kinase protein
MNRPANETWHAIDLRRRAMFLEKADTEQPDALLRRLSRVSDQELGIDARLLARACRTHGIAASHLALAPIQGTFHRLFDIHEPGHQPRLLRVSIFAGPDAAAAMALESRLIARLRVASVPVPECTARPVADGDTVRGTQVTTRADGVLIGSLDSDETRMAAALALTARLLDDVHRISGKGYGPLSVLPGQALSGIHQSWHDYLTARLEAHLQTCRMAAVITGSEAVDVARYFRDPVSVIPREARLLHGDPGGHNVLIQPSGVSALIDWEDALLGDPLFDVASLCCFHPERRHPVIFRALDLDMTPGTELWRRFWLYFLRIAVARTVHRWRFGRPDTPGRPPAARRIQLALARLAGRPVAA